MVMVMVMRWRKKVDQGRGAHERAKFSTLPATKVIFTGANSGKDEGRTSSPRLAAVAQQASGLCSPEDACAASIRGIKSSQSLRPWGFETKALT